jgi:catalase (peroxidase I)
MAFGDSEQDSQRSMRLPIIGLAGITAIESMGGPVVPWEPGRTDYESGEAAEDHRGHVGDR